MDAIAKELRPLFAAHARELRDGIAAAWSAGRRDELEALAHRLVGTAGTVQEDAVAGAARELERSVRYGAPDATVAAAVAAVRAAVDGALAAAPDPGPPARPPDAPAEGVRVVVAIEDNPANVQLLGRIFERMPGLSLCTAATGAEGLRLVREHRPALVLLDLNLPDMDGEEVLRELRRAGARAARVVVVSADADPQTEARARLLGADDYVTKPFDLARLEAAVGADGTG